MTYLPHKGRPFFCTMKSVLSNLSKTKNKKKYVEALIVLIQGGFLPYGMDILI